MFAKAYAIAAEFTHPVIVSTQLYDGTTRCGAAAFVYLNEEGWVVTAAHIWDSLVAHQNHQKEIQQHEKAVQAVKNDTALTAGRKAKKLRQLKSNPQWIVDHSFLWARAGVGVAEVHANRDLDLAAVRLDPFDPGSVKVYPTIKDPTGRMDPGTSLCRLGYPFHEIQATYDEKTRCFELAPGAIPLPVFPIEGIYTRNCLAGKSHDGKYEVKFLETSSPGLRGQSGGPIFDVNGTVWAIQSQTVHFPLGFSPKIRKGKVETEEHQFLNVGLGVHPEVLVAFLKDKNIRFNLANY